MKGLNDEVEKHTKCSAKNNRGNFEVKDVLWKNNQEKAKVL